MTLMFASRNGTNSPRKNAHSSVVVSTGAVSGLLSCFSTLASSVRGSSDGPRPAAQAQEVYPRPGPETLARRPNVAESVALCAGPEWREEGQVDVHQVERPAKQQR